MTSISLITTTIHVPEVLRRYREIGPGVQIIVAGDVTTDPACPELCEDIGARYIGPLEQEKLYPSLSDAIGWRSIQRRNIALLEAIRSGADIVVSVDDDNEPIDTMYFETIARLLCERMRVLVTGGHSGWFNPGVLGEPQYTYRGFPYSQRGTPSYHADLANPRVGIVNGLVLGDPDINATERIERPPVVAGYMTDYSTAINPRTTWAPINSQNTAYVRELAPLAAVIPGIGRYDDVLASYLAQRVMETTDYHVAYGPPFVRQERNEHNLISDLKAELWGMEHTESFCATLKAIPVEDGAPIMDTLSTIADALLTTPYAKIGAFYLHWLDAVAEVL